MADRESRTAQTVDPSAILHLPSSLPSAGAWAIGVSGGADSVALLSLLRQRGDLSLHVIHLNHQTRGRDSDDDADFVQALCDRWSLPFTLARRDQIEPDIGNLPANPSARYRALRLALFNRVVAQHGLLGVVLAHHADDQAETVFQRLARGAGCLPLAGMTAQTRIDDLTIVRPLLGIRAAALRQYLRAIGQSWREDVSNESNAYQRNRVRRILATHDPLTHALLELSFSCGQLRDWVAGHARPLGETFAVGELTGQAPVLLEASARDWLSRRGCPRQELSEAVVRQLLVMAADAASPARWQFPGGVSVHRRRGLISVTPPP